jgi:hypothetical protein
MRRRNIKQKLGMIEQERLKVECGLLNAQWSTTKRMKGESGFNVRASPNKRYR